MRHRAHQGRKSREAGLDAGFSLIELLIVVAIILIITAIAIPNYLSSRITANEASAASMTRTVYNASAAYSSTWSNGFPPSLAALGPAAVATCNTADLIDAVLVTGSKSGYNFGYNLETAVAVAGVGCASPGATQFVAGGSPQIVNTTGKRSFCVSVDGVIHVDVAGAAIPAASATCAALPPLSTQ